MYDGRPNETLRFVANIGWILSKPDVFAYCLTTQKDLTRRKKSDGAWRYISAVTAGKFEVEVGDEVVVVCGEELNKLMVEEEKENELWRSETCSIKIIGAQGENADSINGYYDPVKNLLQISNIVSSENVYCKRNNNHIMIEFCDSCWTINNKELTIENSVVAAW